MNLVQDSGKEFAIGIGASLVSASLGVWWIFVIGTMFAAGLWILNSKQRQLHRLDRSVKKERVKDRIRRHKRAKLAGYENPPILITDPARLLSTALQQNRVS